MQTEKLVHKIKSVKKRRATKYSSLLKTELAYSQFDLKERLNNGAKIEIDELRYIPIKIVSCLESFYKILIAEFIDADEKYLNNAKVLLGKNSFKFNLDLFLELQQGSFSIGELIAFSLNYSRFDSIIENFSIILGQKGITDHFRALKNISTYKIPNRDEIDPTLIEIVGSISSHIEILIKTYELRHIQVHEYMSNLNLTTTNAIEILSAAVDLINVTERYTIDQLYPEIAWTQAEMNKRALKDNLIVENRIKRIEEQLLANQFKEKSEDYKKVIEAWKAYREKEAKLITSFDCGIEGSMWDCLYYSNLNEINKFRLTFLENLIVHDS